ncbi:hypothetical protein P4O66_003927 [Electrophorus voltai]|uniref:Reverse transcriptase domain-containing protein n=1 Tax=Electrophorus voltai TaxID=2609070 RepID=A0AAD8ZRK3_9TELE|nr:hypothetical protein P4O66_003927 [Electrophorus voltai]
MRQSQVTETLKARNMRKLEKYQELKEETGRTWTVNTKIVPVVMASNRPQHSITECYSVQYQDVEHYSVQYQDVERYYVQYQEVECYSVQYQEVERYSVQYQEVERYYVHYQEAEHYSVQYQEVECCYVQYQQVEHYSVQYQEVECCYVQYQQRQTSDPGEAQVKPTSSAFNTIIPSLLTTNLEDLGLHPSLGDWISNFLTDRPQSVRLGNCASSTLTLSTGAPQGCVLSPLLYSLYTYDCTATSSSTIIVRFADDTVVMGLISDNDERAYLEEIKRLENW